MFSTDILKIGLHLGILEIESQKSGAGKGLSDFGGRSTK